LGIDRRFRSEKYAGIRFAKVMRKGDPLDRAPTGLEFVHLDRH
jgi:hypothetical protein